MMPATLFCTTCGAANQSQAAYCGACGSSLQAAQAAMSTIYNSASGLPLATTQTTQTTEVTPPLSPTMAANTPPPPPPPTMAANILPPPPPPPFSPPRPRTGIRWLLLVVGVVGVLILGSGLVRLVPSSQTAPGSNNNANMAENNSAPTPVVGNPAPIKIWNVQFNCCSSSGPFKAKIVIQGNTGVFWEYFSGGDPRTDATGESASDAVNLSSQPHQALDEQRFNQLQIAGGTQQYLFKGISYRKGNTIALGCLYYLVVKSDNTLSGAFFWPSDGGVQPDGNIVSI